jgi:quinoprotein glucose dehydrogenase
MTRAEADGRGMKPRTPKDPRMGDFGKRAAQANTDYAVEAGMFFSPLSVPCNQPPYGRLSAVDMTTGKLIWTQVLGNARTVGPKGIPSHLTFMLGTSNVGGAVVTNSGLFFIGAAMDRYLRAFDTASGKELWKADLPAAANATPMTYMGSDGRQFVVVAAAGALGIETHPGDYLMAYALPKSDTK